jgi:hypothetical protein
MYQGVGTFVVGPLFDFNVANSAHDGVTVCALDLVGRWIALDHHFGDGISGGYDAAVRTAEVVGCGGRNSK